jgi:hypothetical protein
MHARRRPALAALVVGLVVASACSTEEASAPALAGESTAPPTDPPTTTTTSTVPPTTQLATTTAPTTTSAPTTTEPPGPTDPAATAAPVFAGGSGDPWLPLGGWNGSRFTGPTAADGPGWRDGQDVRLSTLGFNPSAVRLGADGESCSGVDGPTIDVVLDPPRPPGFGPPAVAVGGGWPLRPRPVVPVDADVAAYDDAAADLLGGSSADTDTGAIRQIVVTDLDADGNEEALVVHSGTEEIEGQITGYSVLFAVDTATGSATEIDRSVAPFVEIPEPSDSQPPSGPTGTGPGGPSTTDAPDVDLPVLVRHRVLDVLDLNGDRVMEVLVRSWSIEGLGVDVHRVTGDGFRRVAGASCPR